MENTTSVIYFSKDRPLQLELTLYSHEKTCPNLYWQSRFVIVKPTSERYLKAYRELAERYPDVQFIYETSFKENFLECLSKERPYVLFVVDDTIFIRKHFLDTIQENMIENNIGFSLRLGDNTTFCYPTNQPNEMPKEKLTIYPFHLYNWVNMSGDFGYPLELSSSLYKQELIIPILENTNYHNPNELEWNMFTQLGKYKETHPLLMYHYSSLAFSNPINRVQTVNQNRVGKKEKYQAEKLLDMFEKGFRINYSKIKNHMPIACHEEVDLEFIKVEN